MAGLLKSVRIAGTLERFTVGRAVASQAVQGQDKRVKSLVDQSPEAVTVVYEDGSEDVLMGGPLILSFEPVPVVRQAATPAPPATKTAKKGRNAAPGEVGPSGPQ